MKLGYRELLKEASRLKKEKMYGDACQTLKLAFMSAGIDEYIDIHERLRLPVYLCFANKNDEAWLELQRLSSAYTDPISKIAILSKMQKFLEDSGLLDEALIYLCRVHFLTLKFKIQQIIDIHQAADFSASEEPLKIEMKDGSVFEMDFRKMDLGRTPVAFTEAGNPIYDVAHNHLLESLNRILNIEVVEGEFEKICKKLNRDDLPGEIACHMLKMLALHDQFDDWNDGSDIFKISKTEN